MADETVTKPKADTGDAAAHAAQTIVLDFGSKSRRRIKRLRKGQGRLMARVNDTIADLVRNQTIGPSSAVVVVVVKQRRKSRGLFG